MPGQPHPARDHLPFGAVDGNPITKEEWESRKGAWLPTEADEL